MLDESEIIKSTIHLREHVELSSNDKIDNIENLINQAGYELIKKDFQNDFSGFSKYAGGADYIIGFNTRHNWSTEFKRFTLAHELGHLNIPSHFSLLHQKSILVSSPGYYSIDTIEQEANIFAINLLAPPNIFKSKLDELSISFSSLKKLSSYYKISLEAAAIHMINLTDDDCSFVVSNSEREILYDIRSESFFKRHRHTTIKNNNVDNRSNVYTFTGNDDLIEESKLKYWYPSVQNDFTIEEHIFDLGYQNKIGTFITVDPN
ncbi:hypothetical protein CK503_04125 [Aliifodinibius salipaludis]|uniref:IrrE N-terminal-like domain-containing protein n=1 Tax=Fodinibius salipaludis TaxID=2032627 RepID=A0A2A2GDW9_9BACT|nr:ImmA/IrrE family metallo-endopeptidase [Aliifodinibius salipaludis]PAU95390.1 hypothetical protein CK503_04125 [Aliifodinibius salipaludis]